MDPDRRVVAVARRQHGAVTTPQLVAAGLTADAIRHRVNKDWLRRRHRGVYIVGPLETPLTHGMAAVLAYGDGAVLSHHSAAVLWGLRAAPAHVVHVTVAGRDVRSRDGVQAHSVARLHLHDVTRKHDISVTSPARTLLDLVSQVSARELARAVEEAQVHRLVTVHSLIAQFTRYPKHRGTAALREAIRTEPALTRSEAERRLLELIRAARLPGPRTNARLGRHEVDCLWPEHRLVVEVDGYAFHSSRAAFERDRRRDAEIQAQGHRVLRVTWRQIVDEPQAIVAVLAAALAVQPPLPSAFARSSTVSA